MKAHFIIQTVSGVMLAICGEVIWPKRTAGAKVGIYAQVCTECDKAVKHAWVTVK